MSAYKIS